MAVSEKASQEELSYLSVLKGNKNSPMVIFPELSPDGIDTPDLLFEVAHNLAYLFQLKNPRLKRITLGTKNLLREYCRHREGVHTECINLGQLMNLT